MSLNQGKQLVWLDYGDPVIARLFLNNGANLEMSHYNQLDKNNYDQNILLATPNVRIKLKKH